jgi:hypothetical protein
MNHHQQTALPFDLDGYLAASRRRSYQAPEGAPDA